MNYEEMSDFEINKAVHFKMIGAGKVKERYRLSDADFVDVFHNEFGENPGPSVIAVMRYVKDGISSGHNPFGGAFDYCNNPSDAWPIIFANGIAVCPYNLDEESEEYEEMKGMWFAMRSTDGAQFDHKNPLRAAMIVFLMMQEASQ